MAADGFNKQGMRKRISYTTVFFLLGALLFSCGGKKPADPKELGASVYRSKCQPCHGADGAQGIGGAKDLGASVLSLDEKILVITNGRGVMPGYKSTLSTEEIKAVAEYTATLKK